MMDVNRKSLLDLEAGTPTLKILLVTGEQSEIVETQAALARLPGIVVEAVPTLARLSLTLQKGTALPDLFLVDIDTDNPDHLSMLRDFKKVSGIGDIPVVALTVRSNAYAPLRAMRAGATDVLLKPIDLDDAREIFTRVMDTQGVNRESAANPGKAIAFMHLSGGAGATTLAVNAAVALSRMPRAKQTCLIDLDIQFGNAASLLDLPSTSPVQELLDDPARLDEAMLESMMLRHQTGLQVLTAPRALMPLTAYGSEGVRNLVTVAKRHFSFSVIDLPVALAPWTDSVLKSASVIYLVTAVSVPSAHRMVKFLDLLHQEGVREIPLKVVANRHHRAHKRGNEITVAQFEKATGRKVDYMIPNDYSLISLSHGQGRPAVRLQPNSTFTTALVEMLRADLGQEVLEQPKRSLFSFGRTK
jgi:pilus assembly protein CpaE